VLDQPQTDRVREAFAELTDAVDPFVKPPGIESVRATVRRRRQRRLGGTMVSALAVAGVVTLVQLPAADRPGVDETARPTAATSVAPTALPAPPAPPSAAATIGAATASATTTPTPEENRPGRGGTTPTVGPTRAPVLPPPCASAVTAAAAGANLVITGAPVCEGETVAVFWATYETQRDGSQRLFASERHTLTRGSPRVTTTLRESPICIGPWYVVRGDIEIRTTIPVEEVDPYPRGVLATEDGEICLS
jgi:hypothetical protein